MKKLRSIAVGLLMGASCGAFLWVAQTPRPWSEGETLGVAARGTLSPSRLAPPPAKFSRPEELRPSDDFNLPRRETDLLPRALGEVSLEAPAPEGLSPLPAEEIDLAPPAAPVLTDEDELFAEEPATETGADPIAAGWPTPAALVAQVRELAERPACRAWAEQVQTQLERLSAVSDLGSPQAAAALERLAGLADRAKHAAGQSASREDRSKLLAASYALARRLAVWRPVHELAGRREATTAPVTVQPEQVLQRLNEIDQLLGRSKRAGDWRRYLLSGQTRLLAEGGSSGDPEIRRAHARRVLRRLEWPGLTAAQRRFLARREFQDFGHELRSWAGEPFDFPRILETLEAYEQQPSATLARRVAEDRRRLSWASYGPTNELARRLNEHYRNANLRAAVSQAFLNRLAPPPETRIEAIQDTIAGAAVRGHSQSTSQASFRVVPDPRRLRLVLEAAGEAVTDARSFKSGAVFYSNSVAWFHVSKEIAFDGEQVAMAPAVGQARVYDDLRDVETDFDSLPLVNVLAQAIARQGHADAQATVRRQTEQRAALRAAWRMDAEAGQRVSELESRVASRVGQVLENLDLFATPVELQTTATRLIGRYRLAGERQLGAHTARPQAPADSVLSVQVHESAVNNVLNRLPLAGREMDLPTLFHEVTAALGATRIAAPDDLPLDVALQGDQDEPVRIDLRDGLARVTVRLAALKTEDRTWRDVMARAYYRPERDGLSARLVRDGHIELTGRRLHLRDQVALRAIFAKMFTERRKLELIPPRAIEGGKLQGCQVTQLVIRDGWLGLALGPERPLAQ